MRLKGDDISTISIMRIVTFLVLVELNQHIMIVASESNSTKCLADVLYDASWMKGKTLERPHVTRYCKTLWWGMFYFYGERNMLIVMSSIEHLNSLSCTIHFGYPLITWARKELKRTFLGKILTSIRLRTLFTVHAAWLDLSHLISSKSSTSHYLGRDFRLSPFYDGRAGRRVTSVTSPHPFLMYDFRY